MNFVIAKTLGASVEVRPSAISGQGVFALRRFRKGETVLRWRPKAKLCEGEARELPAEEKHYLVPMDGGSYLLMAEPERYVNHCCSPNTTVDGFSDVALRDIEIGEEITGDYSDDGTMAEFSCNCASPNCRGRIGAASGKKDKLVISRPEPDSVEAMLRFFGK